jgi:predicted permease
MMSPTGWPLPTIRTILRRQRRSAGSSALIVTTLALALGASTAVFSVADALLLRAVPFREADQLVAITSAFPSIKLTGMNLSGPEAIEFAQLTRTFSASGPYAFAGLVVQGATEAELANGVEVSEGALTALGAQPFAGRSFAAAEFRPNSRVVILGYGLWRRAFGGDASIVGRVVQLGGVSREVIGIMPDRLMLLNRTVDAWLPLSTDPDEMGGRSDHRFNVVARLASGRSLAEAAADVNRALGIWREETGEMHTPAARMHPLELQPLTRATTGVNREPVVALVGAVLFVLLIACANISNLLVARAHDRRGDVAIQLALGATRARLVADSLSEGLLLAAAGAIASLVVAHLIVDAVRSAWPVVAVAGLEVDYRVLLVSATTAVVCGALIGIAPVMRMEMTRAGEGLKSAGRRSTGGGFRLQNGLIGFQIALAVLLSGSAGLMVRSLLALTRIDLGIDAEHVLRAQVSLAAGSYPEDAQVWGLYERVLERVRALPGVTSASVMSGLPPERRANNSSFLLDGVEVLDHTSIHQVEFIQHAAPGYLRTLGIRMIDGRDLLPFDDDKSAPVALVNETLARQFWPNESAIGHRLKPAGNIGAWFTIVGVVSDVRQNGLQSPVGSELYVPYRQARLLMSGFMPRTMNIVVKAKGDPMDAAGSVRAAVKNVDTSAAISGVADMGTIVDRTIARPRLLAWMFGAFASLALIVAGLGVYAVTSFAVGTRTAEFGVRLALGARSSDILRLVLLGGVRTILIGVAGGTLGVIVSGRLLRNLLFGIQPLDPASTLTAASLISVAALVATFVPARRAARVQPLTALRE